jgi:hypothetical protein
MSLLQDFLSAWTLLNTHNHSQPDFVRYVLNIMVRYKEELLYIKLYKKSAILSTVIR